MRSDIPSVAGLGGGVEYIWCWEGSFFVRPQPRPTHYAAFLAAEEVVAGDDAYNGHDSGSGTVSGDSRRVVWRVFPSQTSSFSSLILVLIMTKETTKPQLNSRARKRYLIWRCDRCASRMVRCTRMPWCRRYGS